MAATTPKTSALKKTTTQPAKAGAVDAKAQVNKTAPKKVTPVAGSGKSGKPATSSASAKKTSAPRESEENTVLVEKKVFSDEQRYRMIAEAAYFRAESCQYNSDPVRDWIEAERDIAILLGEDK
jgi:hypothetical protein